MLNKRSKVEGVELEEIDLRFPPNPRRLLQMMIWLYSTVGFFTQYFRPIEGHLALSNNDQTQGRTLKLRDFRGLHLCKLSSIHRISQASFARRLAQTNENGRVDGSRV